MKKMTSNNRVWVGYAAVFSVVIVGLLTLEHAFGLSDQESVGEQTKVVEENLLGLNERILGALIEFNSKVRKLSDAEVIELVISPSIGSQLNNILKRTFEDAQENLVVSLHVRFKTNGKFYINKIVASSRATRWIDFGKTNCPATSAQISTPSIYSAQDNSFSSRIVSQLKYLASKLSDYLEYSSLQWLSLKATLVGENRQFEWVLWYRTPNRDTVELIPISL